MTTMDARFIQRILDDPHAFAESQVPCHLRGFWAIVRDETPKVKRVIVAPVYRLQQRRQLAQA